MKPTSFSQNTMYSRCQRWWYLSYVKKVPVVQEMCYMYAGSVLHKTLEVHYRDGTSLEEAKELFRKEWKSKGLHDSKLRYKQDQYWTMAIHGVGLEKKFTSIELKIFYPDVIGYIDAVNTRDGEIVDWKSSTRSAENEEEYTKQLTFYSWLYQRKFNVLPKKAIVYYLKYPGTKGKLEIVPTEAMVQEVEEWHLNNRKGMDEIRVGKVPDRLDSVQKCHFFCPYKSLCFGNDDTFKVGLNLYGHLVQVQGFIPLLLHKGLDKKFSYELKDAHFIKKARPMADTWIRFWNQKKQIIPIGFLDGFLKTLKDYAEFKGVELAIDSNNMKVMSLQITGLPDKLIGKELRDYQKEAVIDFIRKKVGVLEIGTGGGKTLIAAEIIRELKVKTLFIVDKIELLNQTKKVFEECIGIDIGVIGSGKSDIKSITIATIQTLIKHSNQYASYLASIRLVVFDECHKCPAKSYVKISKFLVNTEYRLGLSATSFRDDGNDMCIEAVAGPKIVDLSSKKLIDMGWLSKPKIHFIKDYMSTSAIREAVETSKTMLINEKPNYNNYYNGFISDNLLRNDAIRKIVNSSNGKKILVLTKLVEHGMHLASLLGGAHLYGQTNFDDRKQMLEDFRNGKNNILVSTVSIFSEGIDIPELDIVINASANRGDVKSLQMLGRVMRLFEGKKAEYYDFMDEYRFFKRASFARKKIFYQHGHDVDFIDYSNI